MSQKKKTQLPDWKESFEKQKTERIEGRTHDEIVSSFEI